MEWIKVSEHMPEDFLEISYGDKYDETEKVLVYTKNGKTTLVRRRRFMKGPWHWGSSGSMGPSITHWVTIEPPK